MPEEFPVPARVENVVIIVYQVVRLGVLLGVRLFEHVLSSIMHDIRHDISSVMPHYCIFTNLVTSTRTESCVFRLECLHEVLRGHRETANFVLAVFVYAVVLVA